MTPRAWPSHAFFTALLALVVGIGAGGPATFVRLAYYRREILDGEAWRLITTHLVHAGPAHLLANLAGLGLVWAAVGRSLGGLRWLGAALTAALAASAGVLVAQPRVQIMAGLSAVLHGMAAAGAVAETRRGRLRGKVFLGLVTAKILWDLLGGFLPFAGRFLGRPLAAEAHLFGALAGAVYAIWLPSSEREGD